MNSLIQPFDFDAVFIAPWRELGGIHIWVVVMGFLTCLACGMVGVFLVLRRLALTGDAISHSLLPGIVLAFLITGARNTGSMILGAIAAAVVAVVLIEFIHSRSRIKTDAAMGIVFSGLFALGVLLISLFADSVDLDADCVLYGEIAFVGLETPVRLLGVPLGPIQVVRMGVVVLVMLCLLICFYRQILVTSFDPALARSIGANPAVYHYGLMIALAVVAVSAFEAVGSILVVAMLVFPGATAQLFCTRLPAILFSTVPLALLYSLGGFHLAIYLNASIAASMTVVAGTIFACAWFAKLLYKAWLENCRFSSKESVRGAQSA